MSAAVTQIFLDMDGVLSNLPLAVIEAFNLDYDEILDDWDEPTDLHVQIGISRNKMWRRIRAGGREFWANMPPYPWVQEMWTLCNQHAPTTILSSPSREPESLAGKLMWLNRHLGKPSHYGGGNNFRKFLIGPDKSACAHAGALLIDDRNDNCEKFYEAGGSAIVFPQPWNTNADHRSDPVAYVRATLRRASPPFLAS